MIGSIPEEIILYIYIILVAPKETELALDLKLDPKTSREYLENHQLADATKGILLVSMHNNPNGDVRVNLNCDPLIIVIPSDASLELDSKINWY